MARLLAGLLGLTFALTLLREGEGHGRLINPPARSSAWRYGFDTPPDYNDNQLFCGGASVQKSLGGKCGVCGDAWTDPQPRAHENGGKYGTGVIVAEYQSGQKIDVEVQITAAHLGYFEFRLCKLEDTTKPATHECLNRNLLQQPSGETRWQAGNSAKTHSIPLLLPEDLSCDHCVLQWRYHTGNSWGRDSVTGQEGLGYGDQEEFYGCADIKIAPSNGEEPEEEPTGKPDEEDDDQGDKQDDKPNGGGDEEEEEEEEDESKEGGEDWDEDTSEESDQDSSEESDEEELTPEEDDETTRRQKIKISNADAPSTVGAECEATGLWAGRDHMDEWCMSNCRDTTHYQCPQAMCACYVWREVDEDEDEEEEPVFACGFTNNPTNDPGLDELCRPVCSPVTGRCANAHCSCQPPCVIFAATGAYADQPPMHAFCQLACHGKSWGCLPGVCECAERPVMEGVVKCRGAGSMEEVEGFGEFCELVCGDGGDLCPESCVCENK